MYIVYLFYTSGEKNSPLCLCQFVPTKEITSRS